MRHQVRAVTIAGVAVIACCALAPSAAADGLPGEGVDTTRSGVPSPDGNVRFVALPAAQGTIVERISQFNGQVLDSTFIRGKYVVPGVAYDGSTSGISADTSTLVLIKPRSNLNFPRSSTNLAILDAERLSLERRLTLDGDFSFDAISPNGNRMYLVEYVSKVVNEYQVRAFDLRDGRLLPDPIVDPEEEPGDMYGTPMERDMSPDGRWAYTLYIGDKYPFIHALDTERGAAVCIDLDTVAEDVRPDRIGMNLAPDGTIEVLGRGDLIATVDANTFEVSPVAPSATAASADDGGGIPWLPLSMGAAVLGLLLVALRRRRRGDGTADGPLPDPSPYPGHALGSDSPQPGRNGGSGDAGDHPDASEASTGDRAIPGSRGGERART